MRSVENGYRHVVKNDSRDRVSVEVGDLKDASRFHPQMKLCRWGASEAENECNLSIRATGIGSVIGDAGGKIRWKGNDYEVHMYDRADFDQFGAFEFEWVLFSRPARNFLNLSVQHKGLKLFQQAGGTTVEPIEGGTRPENVIGSIALYHESKGGLVDAAGMAYGAGKFGHVLRPEAVDANGQRVWCDLVIVNPVKWRVVIPQAFLDSAAYPVVVDPTFGYTTAGANAFFTFSGATANIATMATTRIAASGDTVTQFTIYASGDGTEAPKLALYTVSGGEPSALHNIPYNTFEATLGWVSSGEGVSVGLNAGSEYCVAYSSVNAVANGINVFYDTGSPPGRFNSTDTTFGASFNVDGTDSGTKYSFYATYTAGSAGPTNLKTVNGLAKSSVKTVNGLAIASVKTMDGLT